MIGIIVATHGDMAKSTVETVTMLAGEPEQLATVAFQPGDSLDTLMALFETALNEVKNDQGTIILADIKGGSPCNVASLLQKTRENIRVVHGYNIPMLLEVIGARDDIEDINELADTAIEIGRFGMGTVTFKEEASQ